MTRKDYRIVAEAVKRMKLTNLARICVAEDLADAFEKDNKLFKREVFLEHCGVLS